MNVELAKLRRDLMLSIRSFFLESDCLEVELPLMGHAVGTDPYLEFFKTTFNSGNKETPLYFHTSPEFWLKRLLAQGYPDIFYLGPTFRNGEVGEQHLPQFSILEWYRLGYNLERLQEEVWSLIQVVWNECPPHFERLTYREAFIKYLDFDPFQVTEKELKEFSLVNNWCLSENMSLNECLDFLICDQIEPELGFGKGVFLTEYPSDQCALAKTKIDPLGNCVAQRFELYIEGKELCNGYFELTDSIEQRKRFEADLKKRDDLDKEATPIDENFMKALESGLPSSSGVALGVDRLAQLIFNKEDINQVVSFPFEAW